jgi:DNA-binding NarL/FixJ family response regulator
MSIRILLADDHKLMRDGLRALLEKDPELQVVSEAANGRALLLIAEKLEPDVVIMDIAMPDINGIEATEKLRSQNPRVKVLALSMHSDRRFVGDMLRAGASGYLLKDCASEELTRALRTVMSGQIYLSPAIAGIVTEGFIAGGGESGTKAREILTQRELEVLQLLSEGKSTKEIAYGLRVSIKTIETYRQKIMDKLELYSVAELTKYAVREGLTALGD